MHNIFVICAINCTIMGNLYYLVLDDSISKKLQILYIALQLVISLLLCLLTAYFIPIVPIF